MMFRRREPWDLLLASTFLRIGHSRLQIWICDSASIVSHCLPFDTFSPDGFSQPTISLVDARGVSTRRTQLARIRMIEPEPLSLPHGESVTLIAEGMIRGIAVLQSARAVAPTRINTADRLLSLKPRTCILLVGVSLFLSFFSCCDSTPPCYRRGVQLLLQLSMRICRIYFCPDFFFTMTPKMTENCVSISQ